MDEVLYQSKSEKRRIERQLEAEGFIKEKKEKAILNRWEASQVTAAGWQSVLDHATNIYQEHKAELDEETIIKTEEQITERQRQIKEFLMAEKDMYLEAMGIQAD
jgi:hypothetical protein